MTPAGVDTRRGHWREAIGQLPTSGNREIGRIAHLTAIGMPGYAASMNNATIHTPVVEMPEASGSASASWISSFYYWFTNPPASLAGQFC
jgi:hypothetical protein